MSNAGRKAKPTALRVMEGNREHRPLTENEPKPGEPSLIPPVWLINEGIKLWNSYALVHKNLGTFKQTDEMSFATWCQEMGRYIELQKIITKKGYTSWNPRVIKKGPDDISGNNAIPEMALARECLKNARALAIEFGMTPSSRTRLSVPDGSGELDPLEEMWKRKKGK